MKLNVTLDFWFDGIDDCSEEEAKNYFITTLEIGSDSCASEVSGVSIRKVAE